jgi:hypothetical protein
VEEQNVTTLKSSVRLFVCVGHHHHGMSQPGVDANLIDWGIPWLFSFLGLAQMNVHCLIMLWSYLHFEW